MKRLWAHLEASFLIFVLSACTTTADPDAGSIQGVVLDQQTGDPVPGVTVGLGVLGMLVQSERPVLPYGGDEPFITTTRRDGTFQFQDLKPGELFVMIQDANLACVEGELQVSLGAGEHKEGIALHVAEGASISGTVYNDGYYHGVEGVVVQVAPTYFKRKEWVRTYEAITDSDGTFHIGGIPSGGYDIRSSPLDGYKESSLVFHGETPIHPMGGHFEGFSMEWGKHYETFEFTVEPGAVAQGVVVDESGRPVAGAEIFYFGRGPEEPGAALTDEGGRFLFPNYEALDVPDIIARKDGHFSERLFSDKTLEEYGPIRLTLRPGANLRVRVVDEKGEPVGWPVDFDINVDYKGDNSSPYERAKEPEPGLFTFPRLPAATYELGMWGEHRDYITDKPGPFTLLPGEDREIVLTAVNTAELHGPDILGKVINPYGVSIANAKLEAIAVDPFQTSTGPDGTFTFSTRSAKSLPTYQSQETLKSLEIKVSATGYMEQVVLARPGDSDLQITLEPTKIFRGYVVDASTGNPIEAFGATVYSTEDPGNQDRRKWNKMESVVVHNTASGEFEISGITSSPFIVEIDAEGFGKHYIEIDSELEKSTTPLGFSLYPKGQIRGIVVDERGIPIGNADLHTSALRDADLPDPDKRIAAGLRANTTSEANGVFYLPLEATGRVSLLVRSAYPNHQQALDVPAGGLDNLRIVVPDGLTVRGRVTSGGEPLPGVVVSVLRDGMSETNDQGEYVMADLAHGQNGIAFSIPQNDEQRFTRNKMISANVVRNQDNTINMDFLPGTATLVGRLLGEDWTAGSLANVFARLPDGEQIVASTPIDVDGGFRLATMPECDAWVTVRTKEGRKHVVLTNLRAGVSESLEIDPKSVATVSGKISRGAYNGEVRIVAIPGVPPAIDNIDEDRMVLMFCTLGRATINGDSFSMDNVPPGRATLVALAVHTSESIPNATRELARTTVDVGPEGMTGIVLDLGNGGPPK